MFVIDIATRRVCLGGITSAPNGDWMKQVARNLTATFALQRVIYLVTIRPQLSSVVVVGPLYGRDITVHAGLNFSM